MPKKVSDSQDAGYVGESEFHSWATKMGWYPTKVHPDHGIDFVCQIRGDRVGNKTSAMPGRILNVSVRSTNRDSDSVAINRSDAEFLLTTSNPTVFALVRRAPIGEAGEVAIKFPDELFIKEIEAFLKGSAETHTIQFSNAIADTKEIQSNVEKLFQQPYEALIARLRTELRLKELIKEPHAEILNTMYGTVAYVHSKEVKTQAEVSQRADIADALHDIDIKVVFTPSSLIPPQGMPGMWAWADLGFAAPEKYHHPSPGETAVKSGQTLDVRGVLDQIRDELSVWNYDSAFALAEELERALENEAIPPHSIIPGLPFLLARVHVIRAEREDRRAKEHIERAKSLLAQIHSMFSVSVDVEMKRDIEGLRGSIENLENGPDAALAQLAENAHPYAIRIRLGILLNKQDLDGAVALIEQLPPNDRWCDLAVTAFALKGRVEDAVKVVNWAAGQEDRAKYPQCVVRLADAMFVRSLAGQGKGKNIQPHDLSEEERISIRKILEGLQPVLDPIVAAGHIDSGLSESAVKIAFSVNHLLGKREDLAKLTQLMYTRRPIPVGVARSVVSGYIDPPPDLPERLRKEHPGDLEANILALVVQSSSMGQHEEAFARAKELIPLADTDKKKDELFTLFEQLWQELKADAAADCERIAESLASYNPKNRAVFKAARALRAKDPDLALRALDEEKTEEDIYWLQLRGNALIQKGKLGEAVDFLLIVAKITSEPTLLHKTADLAFQSEKTDIAAWCYERLLEIQPKNLLARANLASIYTFDLDDIGKAADQFRALHEAEPENPVHTVNLAICLAQLYRPQESLALYNEACNQDKPDIRSVLGRAELYLSLGDVDPALESLQSFRHTFWNNPDFLLAFMNNAYAAGDEEAAHEAFKALNNLRETGGVEANAFRMVPAGEGLEILKTNMMRAQEQREHLHSEMLRGQMPWVWAEQVAGNAIYMGWRSRTQEMAWIGDDPTNRANFCVYATNAFHSCKSEKGRSELVPLESPPEETRVVADISSLITLHRLELLDIAADYFAEIIVPEGYLRTVLLDSRKMVLHQRSRQQNAEQILQKTERGIINVLGQQTRLNSSMAIADEHGKSEEHRYHLTDLIRPVHKAGIISDAEYERISKVSTKKSSVNETHAEISRLQGILVELSTLETLTHFGLLDAVTGYYKVNIKEEACTELRQCLEQIQYQEETRKWHLDLWNRLRDDPRFRFVSHTLPNGMKEMAKKNSDPNDYLPFLASFVALKTGAPLLVDDRVCQVLALNERSESAHAAFGTEALIASLMNAGKLGANKAANAMLRLIHWRYRFILPNADILKALAGQFRTNPPGQALQEIAEYIHDCVRDMGLFGGPEKTDNHESMAMRLYLSWLSVISKFLISIWDDESFSEESARRLTLWSIQELLPSSPRVLHGAIKARMGSLTPKILISDTLIHSNPLPKGKRMPNAMKALKDAFELKDDEYFHIVTGILNDARRTELQF